MSDKPNETDSEILEPETDSEAQDDLGQTDVGGEEASANLAEINKVTKRDFKSMDDFAKHYENLNSLVGDQKRVENEKAAKELNEIKESGNQELKDLVMGLIDKNNTMEFLSENPTAKESMDLVKSVALAKNLSLQDAWENHVKDTAESASAYKEEKEIGVKSKARVMPQETKEIKALSDAVKDNPSTTNKELLVAKMLGLK